jgi:hypothetical protein
MLSADEQQGICRPIDGFAAGRLPDQAQSRTAAIERQALPAFEVCFWFGGITGTGDIVLVSRNPPHIVEPVAESRLIRLILSEASYPNPTLQTLSPLRPPDAQDGAACGRSGCFSFGIAAEFINIGGRMRSVREVLGAIGDCSSQS